MFFYSNSCKSVVTIKCVELGVEISEKYIWLQCIVVCSASSARLRLLRLSEAAEKLKRQAAINVHTGKENDARELLFQKKKVMQAMEKSKNRVELLDELCAKLNEVSEELFRILLSSNDHTSTQELDQCCQNLCQ